MSRFTGKQFKGAKSLSRQAKRLEANGRDAASAHSKDGRKLTDHELPFERYNTNSGERLSPRFVRPDGTDYPLSDKFYYA